MWKTLPCYRVKMAKSSTYWESRYQDGETGWDLNGVTPALQEAVKHLPKDTKILIPGCGLAWDGEALHHAGFTEVYLSDWAPSAKAAFLRRVPSFPENHFFTEDFFEWAMSPVHAKKFDLVLECTFYCAIPPTLRPQYVHAMQHLIKPGGKLMGLLFTFPLTEVGPPYGGSMEEYTTRFSHPFKLETFASSPLSIAPRADKEVFFIATLQTL
jgi:methyl halide transferase